MSSHFYRDLERFNDAFPELGAAKEALDGFRYIDSSMVPARLWSAYRTAILYGAANGLL